MNRKARNRDAGCAVAGSANAGRIARIDRRGGVDAAEALDPARIDAVRTAESPGRRRGIGSATERLVPIESAHRARAGGAAIVARNRGPPAGSGADRKGVRSMRKFGDANVVGGHAGGKIQDDVGGRGGIVGRGGGRLVPDRGGTGGSHGVEVVVSGAGVNGSIGADRRRGVHLTLGCERPLLRAGSGVYRVQISVLRADIDGAVGADRRRGELNRPAGCEFPLLRGFGAIVGQRVEVVVVGADVNSPVGTDRRRGVRIAGCERPLLRAAGRVYRVDVAVSRADVNGFTIGADRRRGAHRIAGCELPFLRGAGAVVGHGIDAMAQGADVNSPVGADRRRAHLTADGERPLLRAVGVYRSSMRAWRSMWTGSTRTARWTSRARPRCSAAPTASSRR